MSGPRQWSLGDAHPQAPEPMVFAEPEQPDKPEPEPDKPAPSGTKATRKRT